jgi:RNA polymerase sigma factor (sigma-70 family)
MERYQQADPEAPAALVAALSPALLRFFRSQTTSREQADDLLQDTWLRIHRVRHTYRPGEPVLPWIYAIARRVRVDGYRRSRRITLHESAMQVLPERPAQTETRSGLPVFRDACRLPAGYAARSDHDVESRRVKCGGGSACNIFDRGGRETETAPRLCAATQIAPDTGGR